MPKSPIAQRLESLRDTVQTMSVSPPAGILIRMTEILDGLIEVCGALEAEIEHLNKARR